MGLRWGDNVVESSTATTTGPYQLAGAPASGESPGAQTFVAGIGDGNTCYYRAEEVGGSDWETGLGTVTDAATDTLTRTTIHASSNGGSAVDWTGKTLRIYCTLPAYAARRMAADHPFLLDNATIVCTRSGGAETFHLKTADGSDPSPENPARAAFLNGSGGFDIIERTSALSVTFSSGSTGGAVANLAFKVGVLLFNNAGTLAMGAVVRPSGIRDNSVVSTTAEGGAGGADSPRVIYSASALSNVRCRVLGYATYTLATPGTWNTAPSEILLTRAAAVEIQARELLYEKTLTANGVFDTDEWWPGGTLPNNYDSFDVELAARSSVSANSDVLHLYINGDTVSSNYHRQWGGGGNGSSFSGESSEPRAANVSAATSPSGAYSVLSAKIAAPGSTKYKTLFHQVSSISTTSDLDAFVSVVIRTTAAATDAITRIQYSPDGYNWGSGTGDQFVSGSTLKLYGLKTMTVLS